MFHRRKFDKIPKYMWLIWIVAFLIVTAMNIGAFYLMLSLFGVK